MKAVEAENLIFSYQSGSRQKSLDDVSVEIKKGEFVALLGKNGSGKTTLARLFNVLLPVQHGTLRVAELNACDNSILYEIRKNCAMVFQNPDNQFVSTLVEEDVAFAPRNFGVAENDIPDRVQTALEMVGLSGFEQRSTHMLSGGQKQLVAVAGVLAAEPDIIVFDEATAMLDCCGREEIMSVIKKLHQQGKTIIMITHCADEAAAADRILLMDNGKILKDGTAKEILTDTVLLCKAGIEPPVAVSAYHDLKLRGILLSSCPITEEELVGELCSLK